jgi:small-conductance mechanosensitive channel
MPAKSAIRKPRRGRPAAASGEPNREFGVCAGMITAELWQRWENLVESLLGGWVNRRAFDHVTWLQLMAAAVVLLATLVVSEFLHWRARRKIREEAGSAAADSPGQPRELPWFVLAIREAHAPLRLLIWIWGLYLACRFLLLHMPFDLAVVLSVLVWGRRLGLIVALFWFLYRMVNVLEAELRRWALAAKRRWAGILVAVIVRAFRLVVPLIGILILIPALGLPADDHALVQTVTSLILTGFIGFIFCQLATTAERAVLSDYRVDVKDNLAMRKIQTQVKILRKTAVALIVVATLALMLTDFDSLRTLGKSLLASAGVAGIVIGVAAQRTLATFIAGVQIAFTQPIRLDDVVIVEGEWGRIEEITMTYVVVAIWDLRRMVLPITYFIEKPFQNWTRARADLLGTVFLYLDYTVPLAPLRAELDRILEASKLWDRKVKVLQMTDAKERTVELRILASAADSSIAWDLRCEIREKMVDFLQRNFPDSLPRARAAVQFPAGLPSDHASVRAPSQSAAPAPTNPGPDEGKKTATDAVSSSLGLHRALSPSAPMLRGEPESGR